MDLKQVIDPGTRPQGYVIAVAAAATVILFTVACSGGGSGETLSPTSVVMPTVTFTVGSTVDAADADPGDGACDDAAGNCTLRAAIMEANAMVGAASITLPAGTYTLSIAGANEKAAETGDLNITDDLIIEGDGADTTIVDGGGLDRVFEVSRVRGNLAALSVIISGVTVRNGATSGVGSGGGILSEGTLRLTDVIVSENTAARHGGGIYNDDQGKLTLSDSTVRDNLAISKDGGGILSRGTVTLTNVTVNGNTAGRGGGIFNRGTLTLTSVTVNGNTAAIYGGGIWNRGTLTLAGSTISNNTARINGGGVFNYRLGKLTLTDTKGSGNQAGTAGGGIYNVRGTLEITDSLISGDPP